MMATLTGAIQQVPSSVSAIKVDGQRAHKLIRAGEEFELAARPVTVDRFESDARRPPRRDSSTWTWRSSAPPGPTSAPSPATWVRRSEWAAT